MIQKCIIPAAGFGTRFLPATKAQPKEMLTIVDTPVIQYLVEEAVSAGITDIMIITSRGKQSIENHFDTSLELESILQQKGKTRELAQIQKIANLARITYMRQPLPRGDGDALLRARSWVGNEPCLVLFGDDLIRGEHSGASQLIDAFRTKQAPIIALEAVPDEKVSSYGIVESQWSEHSIHRISRFLEKPRMDETDSRLGVIGKYIITPQVFDFLEQDSVWASQDGEIRLADAFARMVRENHPVYGQEITGIRYDTGDKLWFLKATIDYALERDDLRSDLIHFLKEKPELRDFYHL